MIYFYLSNIFLNKNNLLSLSLLNCKDFPSLPLPLRRLDRAYYGCHDAPAPLEFPSVISIRSGPDSRAEPDPGRGGGLRRRADGSVHVRVCVRACVRVRHARACVRSRGVRKSRTGGSHDAVNGEVEPGQAAERGQHVGQRRRPLVLQPATQIETRIMTQIATRTATWIAKQ